MSVVGESVLDSLGCVWFVAKPMFCVSEAMFSHTVYGCARSPLTPDCCLFLTPQSEEVGRTYVLCQVSTDRCGRGMWVWLRVVLGRVKGGYEGGGERGREGKKERLYCKLNKTMKGEEGRGYRGGRGNVGCMHCVSSYSMTVCMCAHAQGPLQQTCPHFWQMVWEQNTVGVVMLNKCVERGMVSIVGVVILCE